MITLWAIIAALGIFSALAVYRNLAVVRYRLVPPPANERDSHALVSVIIPARNEASNIRDCVQSVLDQRYRPVQIIVVNDNSTDETGEILAELAAGHAELEVLMGKPLPPGWVGKNHAIAQGVTVARGEVLAFLDADTRLSPDAIGRAVALARQKDLAMLSYLPHHILRTFWEKVIQPVVLGWVLAGASPSMIENPKDSTAGAFGQFILFDRASYEIIGGHEGVKGDVLEDWRMAQKIKGRGLRVAMADGQDLASVRMYSSLSGIWEGWSKNTFLGAGKKVHLIIALLITVFLIGVWPVFLAIWAVLAALSGGTALALLIAAAFFHLALMFYYAVRMNRRLGMPASYALGFPLGSVVFMGILLNSTYRFLSGRGVTWKGRSYAA